MTEGSRYVDINRRGDPVQQVKRDDTDPTCVYVGYTPKMSTLTSENLWQIHRFENVGGVITKLFANDAKYNVVWDDRATYFPACVGDRPVTDLPATMTTNTAGEDCIRVCAESIPQGLSSLGLVTLVPVTPGLWTEVVVTPIAGRRAFAIQNSDGVGLDNADPILLNYAPHAPGGANQGWKLEPGDSKFYDANDAVNIYIRVVTGGASFNIVFEQLK